MQDSTAETFGRIQAVDGWSPPRLAAADGGRVLASSGVKPRICVLLLPDPLEAFAQRDLVKELLRVEGVVACDPPRTSYGRLARLPDGFGAGVAHKQAKRLRRRLPGDPVAVAIFDPAQYPLGRGLVASTEGCHLWYRPPGEPADQRRADLHALAVARAAVVFASMDELWDPLYDLRLGALRP